MSTSEKSLASRFLRGHGIAEAPLAHCSGLLPSCPRPFVFVRSTESPSDAISFLSTLTFPASRHVVFPANERTTAFINNSRNGSDYADYSFHMPSHLGSSFVRVVSAISRIWSNGIDREVLEYEARIFELYNRQGHLLRSVHCMNDGGHWCFGVRGTPHPIESSFPYDSRRKRDRFSVHHLAQLTRAYGFPVVSETVFLVAGNYLLYHSPSTVADKTSCSIAEADDPAYGYFTRGLSWVSHMETHATSVIADFERCVRLNPSYKEKVESYLQEAYRRTGQHPT